MNLTQPTYEQDAEGVWLVSPVPFERTVSRETARNDARAEVPAGRYLLSPVTISGQPTAFEDAYYFFGSTNGTLVSGGFYDEPIGAAVGVRFQPYGYEIRKALA